MHNARMFNFSKDGVYFESNSRLDPGKLVFVIVEDTPYASTYGVMKYYRALIVWRNLLQDSAFDYGYGIQFKTLAEIQEMHTKNNAKKRDPRRHARKSYSRSLRIATKNGIIEGTTKNISPSGTFIATKNMLEVDQLLKVSLPLKSGNVAKITGRVVWANEEGIGVKFLKIV